MSSHYSFHRVTAEDVSYCYRLFLKREPDEVEWASCMALLAQQEVSLQWLTDRFLYSDEFRLLQERASWPQLISLPEMRIYLRPNDGSVGAGVASEGSYEPHVTQALRPLLTPGAVFIDIGANIGYFALLAAARVGAHGRVFAFEPNEANCKLLLRSIAANEFTNIEVHPYAVAEQDQTLELLAGFPDSNGRVTSVTPEAPPDTHRGQEVRAVALDGFLPELARLDVVKIDIEGAEPRAVQGMQQLIKRHRPLIFTELNPSALETTSQVSPNDYLVQLRELAYDLFVLERSGAQSPVPQTDDQILRIYAESKLTHLDLLARPR